MLKYMKLVQVVVLWSLTCMTKGPIYLFKCHKTRIALWCYVAHDPNQACDLPSWILISIYIWNNNLDTQFLYIFWSILASSQCHTGLPCWNLGYSVVSLLHCIEWIFSSVLWLRIHSQNLLGLWLMYPNLISVDQFWGHICLKKASWALTLTPTKVFLYFQDEL